MQAGPAEMRVGVRDKQMNQPALPDEQNSKVVGNLAPQDHWNRHPLFERTDLAAERHVAQITEPEHTGHDGVRS